MDGSRENIIDNVYAVAIEPDRYDGLVRFWEDRLRKVSEAGEPLSENPDERLDTHLRRALDMLDSIVPETPGSAEQAISPPLITLAKKGQINAVNATARQAFDVEVGHRVTDLPFDRGTLTELTIQLANTRPAGDTLVLRGLTEATQEPVGITLTWEGADQIHLQTTQILWPSGLDRVLESSFDLTEAEVGIIRLAVSGRSVQDIAGIRNSAVSTVRTQLRSIFSKTQTGSQSELIRMTMGLTRLIGTSAREQNDRFRSRFINSAPAFPLPYPREEHRASLELPDGRELSYARFGARDGQKCLFLHDEFFGDVWPADMAHSAARRGLTIIAPARPYYSTSDPYPRGTNNTYEQFALDVTHLFKALGLQRVTIVARNLGAAYGYSIMAALPEHIVGFVGIAPTLPFVARENYFLLSLHDRFIAHAIRHNRLRLQFAARAGQALYDKHGPKALMKMVYKDSPIDLEILKNPIYMDAIARGIRFSDNYGHKAFYYDMKDAAMRTNDLTRIEWPRPFRVLIGEHDRNGRGARAEALRDKGLPMDLTIIDDAADMFFYTHPELVLDAIEAQFVPSSRGVPGAGAVDAQGG